MFSSNRLIPDVSFIFLLYTQCFSKSLPVPWLLKWVLFLGSSSGPTPPWLPAGGCHHAVIYWATLYCDVSVRGHINYFILIKNLWAFCVHLFLMSNTDLFLLPILHTGKTWDPVKYFWAFVINSRLHRKKADADRHFWGYLIVSTMMTTSLTLAWQEWVDQLSVKSRSPEHKLIAFVWTCVQENVWCPCRRVREESWIICRPKLV